MSDPVTNVEIEDVLESIRRLVAAGDPAGPVSSQRAQSRQDRLVLTPALRVDCPEDGDNARTTVRDAAPINVMPDLSVLPRETAGNLPDRDPEAASSDHGAVEEAAFASGGDPASDDPPGTAEDTTVTAASDQRPAEAIATAAPLSARTLEQSERLDHSSQDPALEWEDIEGDTSEPAQWSSASHAPEDESQPDGGADEAPAFDMQPPELPEDSAALDDPDEPDEVGTTALWHSSRAAPDGEAEPGTEPYEPARQQSRESRPGPAGRDEAVRRSNLEATIAELEAAVTFSAQDFESDEPDTGIASQSSGRLHLVMTGDLEPEEAYEPRNTAPPATETPDVPVQDYVKHEDDPPSRTTSAPRFRVYPASAPPREPEPKPGPQDNHIAARPDLDDDADLASYLDDESVIDEEALRDLVGQIVREELQGVLGERITRNVRKLVRREIHRILSSQDFD